MMKIIICCLLMVIHFSGYSAGGGGKGSKHDLLKIHVPEIVKHQHHTHYVFIHKHAPKKVKETKKKEVKHHHHKHIHIPQLGHHFFGIHGHKHSKHTTHVTPAVHHKVHKVVHPHVPHSHVKHTHTVHKGHPHVAAKPHPHHGYKVHPVVHKHKKVHKVTHSHVSYPFGQHESNDPAPGTSPPYSISSGYEVTENYDPESEVDDGSNGGGGYGPQADYSESHLGDEQDDGIDYENDSGVSKSYDPAYFSNPYANEMSSYSQYSNQPSVSSYDISPYHQVQMQQVHQPGAVQGISNDAEEFQPLANYGPQVSTGQVPQYYGAAYAGDYENEPQSYADESVPENDFQQHNGYPVSHAGSIANDFGESVPGYANHNNFHNEVNHGVRTDLYDHRSINTGNIGVPLSTNEDSGFHQSYSHAKTYDSRL